MYEFLTAVGHITWGILSIVFWFSVAAMVVIEMYDNHKIRKDRKNRLFEDEEDY